jgi:guanylate kinase
MSDKKLDSETNVTDLIPRAIAKLKEAEAQGNVVSIVLSVVNAMNDKMPGDNDEVQVRELVASSKELIFITEKSLNSLSDQLASQRTDVPEEVMDFMDELGKSMGFPECPDCKRHHPRPLGKEQAH